MGKEYNYHAPRHPPLFLDQTEVRKAEKKFWRPGLPSPYLRVWMTTPLPPLFSRFGSGTAMRLIIFRHG